MADSHAKHHDYHLVDPSPWPLISSVSVLILAIGSVQYLLDSPPWLMIIGFVALL